MASSPESRADLRRARIRVSRIRRGDDENAIDHEYWRSVPPMERLAFVWTLTRQQLEFAGFDADQLRLRRSIANIQRRRR